MKFDLPEQIPIFPLEGVIYFPKSNLPLNIFEQRYLDLVNDCIKKNKLMGMIQSKKDSDEVYSVGCLGRITDYKRSEDGRIVLNLIGLNRFEIIKEVKLNKKYREFIVKYEKFNYDLQKQEGIELENNERKLLLDKTKVFFNKNNLLLNWKEFEKIDYHQQINTLSMIAPISNEEKQKLLETITITEKTKILLKIIDFYLFETIDTNNNMQ
jgi:Lon protease-like protein